jgi:hypothetical protein
MPKALFVSTAAKIRGTFFGPRTIPSFVFLGFIVITAQAAQVKPVPTPKSASAEVALVQAGPVAPAAGKSAQTISAMEERSHSHEPEASAVPAPEKAVTPAPASTYSSEPQPAFASRGAASKPRVALPPMSFIASPNYDARPKGSVVDTVVLHATVIESTERTVTAFLNPGSHVSAHYVVGKDGTVVQMVPDEDRAWHAGKSELYGKLGVNNFSVGIEIVNLNDGIDPYSDEQYEAVAEIIRKLRGKYQIPDHRIVSHAEIARPFGRKCDPLGFDFGRVLNLLQ